MPSEHNLTGGSHSTPNSSLKSSSTNKNYFSYPKLRPQNHPNGTSYSPSYSAVIPKNANHKTRKLKDASYHSISPSPSLSSSSSNRAYSETNSIFNKKWYCKIQNWIRLIIIIVILSAVCTALIFNSEVLHYCQTFLQWMKDDPIKGSFAFICVYTVCSVMMIPGSILTLGAGFVYVDMFGPIKGVIIAATVVWFAASIGATLAFINGRYLLRNVVEHYTAKSSKFALIDSIIGMNGFKVTFLLRLSPITPYNVFNYLMGLTSVRLCPYICACVGMIPDSIVYCFIGGDIASIAKLSSVGFLSHPTLVILTVVGTVAAICGLCYVTYAAKKEFDKMAFESTMSLGIGDIDNFVSVHGADVSPYSSVAVNDAPNAADRSMSHIALIDPNNADKETKR